MENISSVEIIEKLQRIAVALDMTINFDDVDITCQGDDIYIKGNKNKGVKKNLTTELTEPEIKTILNLLIQQQEDGSYYGNKEQYYARLQSCIDKLSKLREEK